MRERVKGTYAVAIPWFRWIFTEWFLLGKQCEPFFSGIHTTVGARGVMVTVVGYVYGKPGSNPVCIAHSSNTLRKGMNPNIFPPAMDK